MKRIFTAAMLFALIIVTGVAINKLGTSNQGAWAAPKPADMISVTPQQ